MRTELLESDRLQVANVTAKKYMHSIAHDVYSLDVGAR